MKLFENVFTWFGGVLTLVISTFFNLLGGYDVMIYSLIVLIALDWFTAVGNHIFITKDFNWRKGLAGWYKKLLYFVLIIACNTVGKIMDITIIRTLIISGLMAQDFISICKNVSDNGLPTKVLQQLGLRVKQQTEEQLSKLITQEGKEVVQESNDTESETELYSEESEET